MSDNLRHLPDWVRSWMMAARGGLSIGNWIITRDFGRLVGALYDPMPEAMNDNCREGIT